MLTQARRNFHGWEYGLTRIPEGLAQVLSRFWFYWLAQKAVHNVRRQRSVEVFGNSNAILLQTERSRRDRDQARDRNSPIGDNDLLASSDALQKLQEVLL